MPTVYLVTQSGCANCPAAKLVVNEALEGTGFKLKMVDLREMDPDLEFRLLEEQLFVASTPSIIIENGGTLKMLSSGKVPTVEQVKRALEAS